METALIVQVLIEHLLCSRTLLNIGDPLINKVDKDPWLHGTYILTAGAAGGRE